MSIKIYNTLTSKKEEFIPIQEGEVKIYNCGPTVYDFFHIGNARNFIIIDVIRRYFEYKNFKVTLVQNITDVDDKIINKAKLEGKTPKEIAEKYTAYYFEDLEKLGIKKAHINPKATEHINEIIELIKVLIKKGFAYELDGDVYFDVSKVKDYGKLSHKNIEELKAGARIEVNEKKKNPLDFALWKKDKGEGVSWHSPWGDGRPGWHTECCVMSTKYLGQPFDIHSGGIDLIFPHHENEIAQIESATDKKFVNFWIHNGHLNIRGEKMSKSLGNFLLVRDILKKYNPNVIRFFILTSHYRSPLDWTEKNISSAYNGFKEFYNTFWRMKGILEKPVVENGKMIIELNDKIKETKEKFNNAMDDDFNTALALSSIFELINYIKNLITSKEFKLTRENKDIIKNSFNLLKELSNVLGFTFEEESISEEIKNLVKEREKYRFEKNWQKADEIRCKLEKEGIILEDTPKGTIIIRRFL